MLTRMLSRVWLNRDEQFVPGKQLFRSERSFAFWAYGLSHSQLLLRARTTAMDGHRRSRIDLVFKPVAAMKTRMDYDGLALRCATAEEHQRILRETGRMAHDNRAFIIESGEADRLATSPQPGAQSCSSDPRVLRF
jgi:hypothetical protein